MSRNPFDHDVTPWGRGPNSGNSLDEHFHQNTNISVSINSPQSRALASQQRALASISNSERVGLGTLEELNEQGEKLSRTEARVKEISELQKQGQQNINSLSSFFGGFKNLFSKKQSESIPKSPPPSRTGSNLSNVSPALIQPDFRRSSEFSHRSYSQVSCRRLLCQTLCVGDKLAVCVATGNLFNLHDKREFRYRLNGGLASAFVRYCL
uniref:Soluble NSF attachment protein 29 n=1 Tax=Schistocephalus solidus TaxID=70667 RepID=A0A0V0JAE9_SCHSO